MAAPTLSVIVPTRNRGALLADAVRSIAPQAQADGAAEVLVVDNASTDDTAAVAAALARELPGVRLLRSDDPGLLAGRHLGAAAASGGLLVFVDDDVVAPAGWLAAYRAAFADPAVGVACGPCLPQWEAEAPWWLEVFRQEAPGGWAIWPLSLIDCGAGERDVPPGCVYGCNLALRREVLRRCGGFHPDAVPRKATAFRGDGESALSVAVAAAGLRLRYAAGAGVRHRVPPARLTADYFLWRSFCQGVSRSYSALRREHGLGAPEPPGPETRRPSPAARTRRALASVARLGPVRWVAARRLLADFAAAGDAGERWHRQGVARDEALRAWVLRPDYLGDARLPVHSGPVLQWAKNPSRGWGRRP